MAKALYTPISIVFSVLGGLLAGADLQADLEAHLRRGGVAQGAGERVRLEGDPSGGGPSGRDLRARKGHGPARRRAGRTATYRLLAGRLTRRHSEWPRHQQSTAASARPARRRSDPPGDNGRAPDTPGQLEGSSKKDTIKRTFKEFSADNGTDYAAALTYYGVLAVFPALIALVSLLGLFGQGAIDELIKNVEQVAPGPAQGDRHRRAREPEGQPGRRRNRVRDRPRAGDQLGLRLHRRLHPRVERDLRGRGGAPDLEAQARADRHHPGAAGPARARDRRAWP